MQEHLHKYLVLYRKLRIPKLGIFMLKDEPAYLDADAGKIFPPKPVLIFEELSSAVSDRFFFDFLAEEMGIDDISAIQAFNDYSEKLLADVQDNDLTVFEGLGNFTKSADGQIVFTAETHVNDLLPTLNLEKEVIALSPVEEKEKIQNDYWWFYAIVLLILGLGALAYYYL